MEPLQAGVASALHSLVRPQPLSPAKVAFAWRVSVGERLAGVSTIRLAGHTLVVDVADERWAREIRRARPLIAGRLGSLLGDGVVGRLQIRSPGSSSDERRRHR